MNEFKLMSAGRQPAIISETPPADFDFRKLPGARLLSATGDFGRMIFQHFKGDGFNIWFSSYRMKQTVKFMGGSDAPVLELHIHYTNNFFTGWAGLNSGLMHHRQYQMSFVPFVETIGEFTAGQQYDTFDIHFYREMLEPYAAYCPRLGRFLENVDRGTPANMLDVVLFLTPGMEQAIHEILSYSMFDGIAAAFFKRKVEDLLVHMVYHLSSLENAPRFDEAEIRKAEEAKKIILSDLSIFDSVEILARKVGTTEAKLQLAFKHLYGITVGRFSKDERMKKAHDMLMYTNEILLAIALYVGYNDAGNFSTAFKNHFGYSPGHVQKRMRYKGGH